jgi:predicted glycoside hydrolase/deacetylase ChbG (UPF0249 family)
MTRTLIITADDYGMCPPVNGAIEECMRAGTVRTTCVMTNMPFSHEASGIRRTFPQCSLGIHWTLTDGQPVSPVSQVPTLVGAEGTFHSAPELRRRWLKRIVRRDEIIQELDAQHRRFLDIAGKPDYWNTHENFHVLPGLFDLCVDRGLQLGIRAMRCHRRFTVSPDQSSTLYHLQRPVYTMKRWLIGQWSRRAKRQGMLMPDGMIHMPGYEMALPALQEVLSRLPWTSIGNAVELVVHPAVTSDHPLFRMNAELRVQEYQVLSDRKVVDALKLMDIQLSNFEPLSPAA